MREIAASDITDAIARLAVEATHFLPEDVEGAIRSAKATERSPLAIQIIDEILENAEIAAHAHAAALPGHRQRRRAR